MPVLSTPGVSGSTELTTGFDEPVTSAGSVRSLSFAEGLRMTGSRVEGLRMNVSDSRKESTNQLPTHLRLRTSDT
jgi:hypothetical protein